MSRPRVTITGAGRSGLVVYTAPAGEMRFHWEVGGNDALAMVFVGPIEAWQEEHPWAVDGRRDILRLVANEVIRQKAAGCVADVDDAKGWITFRRGGSVGRLASPATDAQRDAVEWWDRLRSVRLKAALAGGVFGVVLFLLAAIKSTIFSIDPGTGTPVGRSVRTQQHVATLIRTLEPYTPSLDRDHSKDTYEIGVFIVPLDGSASRLVPISGGHSGNSLGLAKILGSDGRTLWFDVNGTGGVDLETFDLVQGAPAKPRELDGARPLPFAPRLETHLASGFFAGPDTWLGLLSSEEAERELAPRRWLRRITHAAQGKQMRRLHRTTLGETSDTGSRQVLATQTVGDARYLDAAFLRVDEASEPIRLRDPDGALMIFTSEPGRSGTVVLARVDAAGDVVWRADTQLDRFTLQEILPAERSTALVGTRPPVPNQVSEPLLVLVENATGEVTTHSLWR